ncbi:MAG: transglycosylase domain-containing protein, partial [Bacteroidales bacterium]
MARGNPDRTYTGKIIEMLSAVKLELFRSKKAILKLYAANAPFGGNTVGIEAAAWRYTGRGIADMTWAEAATLAVLPNAPSLIYPGRNSEQLKLKRDRLLLTLAERGHIDTLTCELAMGEPLPGAALPMPSLAPHLTDRVWLDEPGTRRRTTVDPFLQRQVSELVDRHVSSLEGNGIHNAAAVVVEVATGNAVAWVGNSTLPDNTGRHGRDVDMITAPRSTGSIMKPFLYAGLLSSGQLLPNALVPDIPTRFQGFRPENADFSYSGAVPAGDALARSLNIPAVRMLQMYEEERFLLLLRNMGFTTFTRPASHYGLSLILGGGEATLWELASAYASMARVLTEKRQSQFSPASIWLTYEALRRVNRPETETGWQYFGGAPEVAWKTGTSFGYRDAWAIGTTPDYVVAVWAGNADGEGRPGLSGITSAAPLLFDVIRLLPPAGSWFTRPEEGMTLVEVCSASGYRAGPDCTERRTEWIPEAGLRSEACPYHTVVNLDPSGKFRVNSTCATPDEMVAQSWFVLPPAMEYYYRMRNPSYKTLPPFRKGCSDDLQVPSMEFIYPPRDARIFIPRSLQGRPMSMLPEIAHRRRDATVY